jgi:hypothetical protein
MASKVLLISLSLKTTLVPLSEFEKCKPASVGIIKKSGTLIQALSASLRPILQIGIASSPYYSSVFHFNPLRINFPSQASPLAENKSEKYYINI